MTTKLSAQSHTATKAQEKPIHAEITKFSSRFGEDARQIREGLRELAAKTNNSKITRAAMNLIGKNSNNHMRSPRILFDVTELVDSMHGEARLTAKHKATVIHAVKTATLFETSGHADRFLHDLSIIARSMERRGVLDAEVNGILDRTSSAVYRRLTAGKEREAVTIINTVVSCNTLIKNPATLREIINKLDRRTRNIGSILRIG